ncbi:MAG: TolC family protein, partial [Proteobacteria bacterium]|nr:TolC family protein [Pseudomonadota bacterium]
SNLRETLSLLTGLEGDYQVIDNIEIDQAFINEDYNTEERAEIEIAKRLLYLKTSQLKETDSDYYPKFYAGTGINYEENKYRVNDYNYFLTFGMKVNLYSGNSTTNEKLSITREIEEEREKLSLARDIVKTDIKQALNDFKTAEHKKEVAKTAITQAEENLKIQQGKYEEHLIPATELIDATLLLSRARLNYTLAFFEYKTAYLKLYWAKGKLVNLWGGK